MIESERCDRPGSALTARSTASEVVDVEYRDGWPRQRASPERPVQLLVGDGDDRPQRRPACSPWRDT